MPTAADLTPDAISNSSPDVETMRAGEEAASSASLTATPGTEPAAHAPPSSPGPLPYLRRHPESVRDYLAKRRQVFQAQMRGSLQREEAAKLEGLARSREAALQAAEAALDRDTAAFESHLKRSEAALLEAVGRADQEAAARQVGTASLPTAGLQQHRPASLLERAWHTSRATLTDGAPPPPPCRRRRWWPSAWPPSTPPSAARSPRRRSSCRSTRGDSQPPSALLDASIISPASRASRRRGSRNGITPINPTPQLIATGTRNFWTASRPPTGWRAGGRSGPLPGRPPSARGGQSAGRSGPGSWRPRRSWRLPSSRRGWPAPSSSCSGRRWGWPKPRPPCRRRESCR